MISADQVFLLYEVSNVAFRSFSAWCTDQFIFLQSHILQLLKFDVLINSFFLQSHILHLVQFDVLINSNSCDFFTFCSLLCWCTDQFKFPWLFHLLQLFLNFLYFLFSLFNKKKPSAACPPQDLSLPDWLPTQPSAPHIWKRKILWKLDNIVTNHVLRGIFCGSRLTLQRSPP